MPNKQDTTGKAYPIDTPDMKCAYRIVDASYRVHTRLYKLHYALIHVEKTILVSLRNNISTSGIIISASVGFILLYIQIAEVKLSSASLLTLVGVISALLLIYSYQYKQTKGAEKEIEKISRELKEESLQHWPDYLMDEVAKWGTRILMAKDVLEENEKISNKQDELYKLTKKSFIDKVEESLNRIKKYKEWCDVYLFNWNEIPGKDSDKLKELLEHKYRLDWVKKAKIKKTSDGGSINVATKQNSISLKLNNEKTKVILEMIDGRTDELTVKIEDGKLNIYKSYKYIINECDRFIKIGESEYDKWRKTENTTT